MKDDKPLQTEAQLDSHPKVYQQNFTVEVKRSHPQPPIVQKPDVIVIQDIPRTPNISMCRYCNQNTDTYITYRNGPLVWIMFFVLLIFTIILCWLAFFIDSWKDMQFRCVKCHQVKYVEKGKCC